MLLISGLFSPLLRLLATHFPQLCLVEDWMYEDSDSSLSSLCSPHGSVPSSSSETVSKGISVQQNIIVTRISVVIIFISAFSDLAGCPAPAMLLMRKLLSMPPKSLWQVANTFISQFRSILGEAVPRQVQGNLFFVIIGFILI